MNPALRVTLLSAALAAGVAATVRALGGPGALWPAAITGVALALFVTLGAGALVRRLYRARPVDASSAPGVVRIVDELAGAAQVPAPRVWMVDDAAPGAFATGILPRRATIVLTTGLLALLSERELRAVVAHEIAHIRRRDTGAATLCVVLAGVLPLLALALAGATAIGDDEDDGAAPEWLLAGLAPLTAAMLGLALDAAREFDADREAGRLCGDPQALADALTRIERAAAQRRLRAAERHPQTAVLLVVPTGPQARRPQSRTALASTRLRIERLRAQAMAPGPQV